ncbi:PREDICTED: uncharacterized protein LOC102848238 [Elephantulus edwardii]|uniref:uncharacterized protein LOC102848238 n=1 Tax=Elephantulus edwardii TaxID=28737 RepID=UPI0003F0E878|nr:PREDICTED: uncharacterized protein LOC102848238 [Elephantulus edwardii]
MGVGQSGTDCPPLECFINNFSDFSSRAAGYGVENAESAKCLPVKLVQFAEDVSPNRNKDVRSGQRRALSGLSQRRGREVRREAQGGASSRRHRTRLYFSESTSLPLDGWGSPGQLSQTFRRLQRAAPPGQAHRTPQFLGRISRRRARHRRNGDRLGLRSEARASTPRRVAADCPGREGRVGRAASPGRRVRSYLCPRSALTRGGWGHCSPAPYPRAPGPARGPERRGGGQCQPVPSDPAVATDPISETISRNGAFGEWVKMSSCDTLEIS